MSKGEQQTAIGAQLDSGRVADTVMPYRQPAAAVEVDDAGFNQIGRESVIKGLRSVGADIQVVNIGQGTKHKMQSAAVHVHSEDGVRSVPGDFLGAEDDAGAILADAQSVIG